MVKADVTATCLEVCFMLRTSLLVLSVLSGLPGIAFADGNTYGDEYGNVIMQEAGGPKIIFVGSRAAKSDVIGRDVRRTKPVYKRASGPSVIYPAADPLVVGVIPAPNTSCDAPIVIKGLSYRYGLDRNEIAILGHPGCPD
ncbi:hypothetical protein [Phyllobacterium sp. CCNWLW11]|uniref:hypothetical protein n=2 Tax=unclassified Phyllobacterium TaxID=2638441 RepID=UPI003012FC5A